jgi:hypothetical protein
MENISSQKSVKQMLDELFELFLNKFKDVVTAWTHFLEFLAVDNRAEYFWQVHHKFEYLWEDQVFIKKLLDIYNSELLRSGLFREEMIDSLINIYFKIVLMKEYLPEKLTIKQINPSNLEVTSTSFKSFFDISKESKKVKLGLIEDLEFYLIAITIQAIYDFKAYLLYADKKIHNIDIKTPDGKFNWQFANKWHPEKSLLRKQNSEKRLSTK